MVTELELPGEGRLNGQGVLPGVRSTEEMGQRKSRKESDYIVHTEGSNCWPEISAAVFPLWVTHESGRLTWLVPSPEKHPSPLPRNATGTILGIHPPTSSIFPLPGKSTGEE